MAEENVVVPEASEQRGGHAKTPCHSGPNSMSLLTTAMLRYAGLAPILEVKAMYVDIKDNFIKPIVTIYDTFKQLYNMQDVARSAFETARAMLNKIMAPKFSMKFTTGVRKCNSKCGCGAFPSTGKKR